MKRRLTIVGVILLSFATAAFSAISGVVDNVELRDSVMEGKELKEVNVVARRAGLLKVAGLMNGDMIGQSELFRAACCNLGESFTTNPSVDVSYADAATGAQQIRLLGLSGTYVQMLTENIPNYRGAAAPYALGYVPGTWMQSIQVSKGCSSVKNGYESITGQINIEFKKPQATQFLEANAYVNTKGRYEGNFQGNLRLSSKWSTALLLHHEDMSTAHDGNGDGFMDMPKVRQSSVMNRWIYQGQHLLSQFGIRALKERRRSGQSTHHQTVNSLDHQTHASMPLYQIGINNERYEAFAKNAYILGDARNTNIALILSGSLHKQDATYGLKLCDVDEKNLYASLMYEADYGEHHSLSAGVSLVHDYFKLHYRLENTWSIPVSTTREQESTPGVYAQYTYKRGETLTLMGGIRIDHSSRYGTFCTPRAHLKWSPWASLATFRLSVGKGYRTSHALAENNFLLASGRYVEVAPDIEQEEAWNYGVSAQFSIPLLGKTLSLNAEYYYTDFRHQLVTDMDTDPHKVLFTNLAGSSYSHTCQFELSYPFFRGFTMTAAYRRTDVKSTYGGMLMEKPLTNRYKALLTMSYKPGLEKWQFDVTLQLNGGGRLPRAYTLADGSPSWNTHFSAYEQLSAQVTRHFRHWSIYAGGENITNFKQKNPIINADDPWSNNFDSTLIWGPIHGAVYYLGVRFNWNKL